MKRTFINLTLRHTRTRRCARVANGTHRVLVSQEHAKWASAQQQEVKPDAR